MNANDGGIDFVMRPIGRFFQVTETILVTVRANPVFSTTIGTRYCAVQIPISTVQPFFVGSPQSDSTFEYKSKGWG